MVEVERVALAAYATNVSTNAEIFWNPGNLEISEGATIGDASLMLGQGYEISSTMTLDIDGVFVADMLENLKETLATNSIKLLFYPRKSHTSYRSKLKIVYNAGVVDARRLVAIVLGYANVGLSKDVEICLIGDSDMDLEKVKQALQESITVSCCSEIHHDCTAEAKAVVSSHGTKVADVPVRPNAVATLSCKLFDCYIATLKHKLTVALAPNPIPLFYLSVFNTKSDTIAEV
jgi:hypothetical protein